MGKAILKKNAEAYDNLSTLTTKSVVPGISVYTG